MKYSKCLIECKIIKSDDWTEKELTDFILPIFKIRQIIYFDQMIEIISNFFEYRNASIELNVKITNNPDECVIHHYTRDTTNIGVDLDIDYDCLAYYNGSTPIYAVKNTGRVFVSNYPLQLQEIQKIER